MLLTACPRAEKPVAVSPPSVESAPQPRLLYRRSAPVHLERWCQSAGDALLAHDQGKVLLVRADGSVRTTGLEGFPCESDGEFLSLRLKGEDSVLSRLLSSGEVQQTSVPPSVGCVARGSEVTLLHIAPCVDEQENCGSIGRHSLSTGTVSTVVPFGHSVAVHAAWVGAELIWTGLFENAYGVWSSKAGTTQKIADSPASQSMCCELAASQDVVLLAQQRRLVRLDRPSGLMRTVFDGYANVRSVVLVDAERAIFVYGARIASLALKDDEVTTLAATSSTVDRVVRPGGRLLWCQQDGVYVQ